LILHQKHPVIFSFPSSDSIFYSEAEWLFSIIRTSRILDSPESCFRHRCPPFHGLRNITVPLTTPFDLLELPPSGSVSDKAVLWSRADDQKKKITVCYV